jgi:hypothetical protein
MSSGVVEIADAADLDRLIAAFTVEGFPHRAELVRAVRRHEINLVELQRESPTPTKVLESSRLPTIVLIGDDDPASTGPTGWTGFRRLEYWARAGFVHATGATVASYDFAVQLTVRCGRLVLIETASQYADEWTEALMRRRIRTMKMIPPPGQQHPIAGREACW